MELIHCWGCGHLGPEGDPDGLCPACSDQGDSAEVVSGECVEPYQVPETGEAAMFVRGESDLGPLFGAHCPSCERPWREHDLSGCGGQS